MSERAGAGLAEPGAGEVGALVLRLDGYEGPLDLLLELARTQKVDLARISVLALVEQFLAVVEGARRVRLELAADWLVMAAWLAWLKSRLLLPDPEAETEAPAGMLTSRLAELERMRAAARLLDARAQLGRELFARGVAESLVAVDRSRLAADLPGLLRAYLAALRRAGARDLYRPALAARWSVRDALSRLASLLGSLPDWSSLERFLPPDPELRRAALASTLLAGLELARDGTLALRQERAFGPILVRAGAGRAAGRAAEPAADADLGTEKGTDAATDMSAEQGVVAGPAAASSGRVGDDRGGRLGAAPVLLRAVATGERSGRG